jgi:ribose-phosphate pyrophosphokinase
MLVRRFSDGEILVEIGENVRGVDVFVIQPTAPPVNDNLMELLIIIDAMKRASARRITAVLPYYGYARQDRKVAPRVPISAKLVADLLTTAGASRVLCLDLHAGQIGGFFNIPVDHLFAAPVMLDYLRNNLQECQQAVVVSPDAGGVERARALAKRLNAALAIIDKRREKANVAHAMHIIGRVKGRLAIVADDMVDTAGTLTESVRALSDHGATEVWVTATHPVFSGPAVSRIESSTLTRMLVTNTIPLSPQAQAVAKIIPLSVAPLLGEAIRRIHMEGSVSSLFV